MNGQETKPNPDKGVEYLLRGINRELWKSIQHRAIDEGLSKKDLVIKALREYLKKGEEK